MERYETCYAVETVGQKLVFVDPTRCPRYVRTKTGFAAYKTHCQNCRGYRDGESTVQRLPDERMRK